MRPRLASLRLPPAREHEIVQELSQHLEDRWRDLVAGGTPEDEATRLALAEFREGDLLAQHLAPLQQAQTPIPITPGVTTGHVLRDVWLDLRYAARTLRTQPGFTVAAVLTLALGIGANAAIFSLTDQVLLRPLPVPRPHELVMLDSPGMYQGSTRGQQTFSEPMFRGLRGASAPVLSGMFARFGTGASVSTGGDAARVRIEAVSGDYFRTLGTGPTIGRVLGPDDDRTPDGHPVVVLSHAYWQNRFGGDPGVVGRSLRVNGVPMTIVGVAAPGFSGFDLGRPADLFAPLMMDSALTPTWQGLNDWRERWLHVSGRLRPGVTPEPSLIWNDPLSSPDFSMVAWQLPSKRQLAHISAFGHVADAVSRGAEGAAHGARSPGCRVRHVVLRGVGDRAVETTDARGRFDDESR